MDGTDARIDALREQITVAERQVELQQTDLDNTVIRAPFSGVAISKDAQPGEMVSPVSAGGGFTRTGICTIVDMRSLEIEVDVNESYINRVRAGPARRRRCSTPIPTGRFPAHVITMVPTADRQKATVLVRIGVREARSADPAGHGRQGHVPARSGRHGGAPAAQPTTLVPKAAIQTDGRTTSRSSSRGDRVERRAVKVGGTDGDRVEVVARPASRRPRGRRRRPPDLHETARKVVVQSRDASESAGQASTERPQVSSRAAASASTCCRASTSTIPKGDFLALMGPSGSGKTTLLNLIGGLDPPTRRIGRRRRRRHHRARRRRRSSQWRSQNIGFVFQLYNLLPVLTAERNVELPLLLTKLVESGAAQARRRSRSRSSAWPIARKHYPRQLSGGQEQRVGIARAIVTDPTLLLCDEPTGDLDRKAGDEILELLQALNREHGKTIVMVTHDPHAAERATRTLHLEKGTLMEAARMKYPPARLAEPAPRARSARSSRSLSIFIAFVLFAFLMTIRTAFSMGVDVAGVDRLMLMHKVSLIQLLPISYLQRHPATPGVTLATHSTWFGGTYQDKPNAVRRHGRRPRAVSEAVPGVQASRPSSEGAGSPTGRARSSARTRRDAVRLEGRRPDPDSGRRSGSRSRARPGTSTSSAIYDGDTSVDKTNFFFRYDYLDENRARRDGQVGWYIVKIDDPAQAAEIARDARRAVRELVGRDQDRDREGVPAGLRNQIGNIGAIMIAILVGRVVHAILARGGQHDGAVGARADQRARGAEDARVLRTATILSLVLAESLLHGRRRRRARPRRSTWLLVGRGSFNNAMLPVFVLRGRDLVDRRCCCAVRSGSLAGALPAAARCGCGSPTR